MGLFLSLVFKPEELRQALMPTLEALYKQDPESLPFRQPVDPMLLGIPVSILNDVPLLKASNCYGSFAQTWNCFPASAPVGLL